MRSYLRAYLREKPFFFSLLRPKEASLYQTYKPFKKPILDLGCGDGFFAEVAFGKVDVGIDPDNKDIREAKNRKVYKTVRSYNGKKIPYPDAHFATVFCNSTFEHIPNIDEVLLETARVLKTGGMLYFTVPTDIWQTYLFGRIILGIFYERYFIKKSKHYNLFSFEQWHKKLSELGLKVAHKTYYLDNKTAMWLFDVSHYLSAPSLLSKRFFNRWVIFPQKVKWLGPLETFLQRETSRNSRRGPYLFIAARKM